MEDLSAARPVRLRDYMIKQRCGADPDKQLVILALIYSGKLEAFTTASSAKLPAGASIATVLRHAMNTDSNRLEVPALSDRKVKDEIGKALAGRDADWQVIDSLILYVPTIATEEFVTVEAPAPAKRKAKSVNDDRAAAILAVIEKLGLDRYAINGPTKKGGRDGERAVIFRNTPPDGMGEDVKNDAKAFERAFGNAWDYMLRNEMIRPKEVALAA